MTTTTISSRAYTVLLPLEPWWSDHAYRYLVVEGACVREVSSPNGDAIYERVLTRTEAGELLGARA